MYKLLITVSFIGFIVLLLNTVFKSSPEEMITLYGDINPLKSQPRQSPPRTAKAFERDGFIITPLADFEISARVLGRENYYLGKESSLSPLDLTLGWGRMSDPEILEQISIRQSSRWYYWSTSSFPIPRREIETHSANMHMIPANEHIEDLLDDVDEGRSIYLKGQLVRVDADNGWRWVSSLSREDTGARACELVYVTDVVMQ